MMDVLTRVATEFWGVLMEMSPYLLFGFLMAGLLSVWISPSAVERHLGGRGIWPVVKAAAFGVPLPLCSCGVIPVAASLRRHGASRGATTAFLISTPQTGMDSIMVTYSLLGAAFAIFRPVAALVSGILGGALVALADKRQDDTTNTNAQVNTNNDTANTACEVRPPRGLVGKIRQALAYGFVTLPADIGRSLVVGLVVAAVISAAVPPDYFAGTAGASLGYVGTILLMMLAGIPVYVCATASVPIAAAMIHMGISPGAAFAFLVTGPATNAATVATIWKVMGRRTTFLYLLTMAASAFGGAIVLDRIVTVVQVQHHMHEMGWMMPWQVGAASSAVLAGVLGYAVGGRYWRRWKKVDLLKGPAVKENSEWTLHVGGMTCSHCAGSVRRAILECRGVESAQVDLPRGLAVVKGRDVDLPAMRKAVEALGFSVAEVPKG